MSYYDSGIEGTPKMCGVDSSTTNQGYNMRCMHHNHASRSVKK